MVDSGTLTIEDDIGGKEMTFVFTFGMVLAATLKVFEFVVLVSRR